MIFRPHGYTVLGKYTKKKNEKYKEKKIANIPKFPTLLLEVCAFHDVLYSQVEELGTTEFATRFLTKKMYSKISNYTANLWNFD